MNRSTTSESYDDKASFRTTRMNHYKNIWLIETKPNLDSICYNNDDSRYLKEVDEMV